MDKILVGVAALTLAGYVASAFMRPSLAAEGLNLATEMFLQSVPWIIVSMFAAGLIGQFFDTQMIARWFGSGTGIRGIITAAILGLFGTGSRWAVYPLAASLLAAEATPGSVFAFMTSWQLVSVLRIPAEFPFLGVRFTVVRAVVSVVIAVAGGVAVNAVSRLPR